jgi:hypothetical protein
VKTLEVPKSGVNPDRSSKETRVDRLACSGIRHSGETKCAKVKTPEVSKELIQTIHQKKHVSTDWLVWEFNIREKQGVIE